MELGQNNISNDIVMKLILKEFSFLEEDYLYSYCFSKDTSQAFLENLNVEYSNEVKRRKIRIGYTKINVSGEIKFTFSLSITRIPYSGVNDFFSLSNYLQSMNKDFSTSVTNDFNEFKAEEILVRISNALKDYAIDIIDGSNWLETFYPRKD